MVLESVAVATFACIAVILYERGVRRRVKRRLAERERTPASVFGSRNYTDATEASIAAFIAGNLREVIGDDAAAVVAPGDRLVDDLRIGDLDSLVATAMIEDIEQRFAIAISDDEAARVATVDDLVKLVASKILPCNSASSMSSRQT